MRDIAAVICCIFTSEKIHGHMFPLYNISYQGDNLKSFPQQNRKNQVI
jgi:hypothetical protein